MRYRISLTELPARTGRVSSIGGLYDTPLTSLMVRQLPCYDSAPTGSTTADAHADAPSRWDRPKDTPKIARLAEGNASIPAPAEQVGLDAAKFSRQSCSL